MFITSGKKRIGRLKGTAKNKMLFFPKSHQIELIKAVDCVKIQKCSLGKMVFSLCDDMHSPQRPGP